VGSDGPMAMSHDTGHHIIDTRLIFLCCPALITIPVKAVLDRNYGGKQGQVIPTYYAPCIPPSVMPKLSRQANQLLEAWCLHNLRDTILNANLFTCNVSTLTASDVCTDVSQHVIQVIASVAE
jgi:hypothetical protein